MLRVVKVNKDTQTIPGGIGIVNHLAILPSTKDRERELSQLF